MKRSGDGQSISRRKFPRCSSGAVAYAAAAGPVAALAADKPRRPDLALADVLALWLAIGLMLMAFWRIS
jgi:uncharacterized membrane protein